MFEGTAGIWKSSVGRHVGLLIGWSVLKCLWRKQYHSFFGYCNRHVKISSGVDMKYVSCLLALSLQSCDFRLVCVVAILHHLQRKVKLITMYFLTDNVLYSGHESGAVMSWEDIDEELKSETMYMHHRRVTSIAGLDMGMIWNLPPAVSRNTCHSWDDKQKTLVEVQCSGPLRTSSLWQRMLFIMKSYQ